MHVRAHGAQGTHTWAEGVVGEAVPLLMLAQQRSSSPPGLMNPAIFTCQLVRRVSPRLDEVDEHGQATALDHLGGKGG